jgi:hypothetical protein
VDVLKSPKAEFDAWYDKNPVPLDDEQCARKKKIRRMMLARVYSERKRKQRKNTTTAVKRVTKKYIRENAGLRATLAKYTLTIKRLEAEVERYKNLGFV